MLRVVFIAAIATVFAFTPILLLKYGKDMRRKSNFAVGDVEQEDEESGERKDEESGQQEDQENRERDSEDDTVVDGDGEDSPVKEKYNDPPDDTDNSPATCGGGSRKTGLGEAAR